MKLLTTVRYEELVNNERKVKQASNEIQRKEFCIKRKQQAINSIYKLINKIPNKVNKQELINTLHSIKDIVDKQVY